MLLAQVASDLHLEFIQSAFPGELLLQPTLGADVLILAGDIANGVRAIECFANWPVPVLYVAGNHEFYGHNITEMRAQLRERAQGTAVQFLDNDVVEIKGVRFLGATLWTDYKLLLASGVSEGQAMRVAGQCLRDHKAIKFEDRMFTPGDALREHQKAVGWLETQFALPFEGPTAVITHHGPHPKSVHKQYEGDSLNAAFISDLSTLLSFADVWFHGHTHSSFDYRQGCRVVANPRGYPMNLRQVRRPEHIKFENQHFEPTMLVQIGA